MSLERVQWRAHANSYELLIVALMVVEWGHKAHYWTQSCAR
jgi:hypothetical protein